MIKNILRIIDDFYIKLMISTSGWLYCFLFNFRALMLGRDVRFKDLKHKNYLVKDKFGQRYFKTEKLGFSFYNKGIKSRALEIGNDYHLDKIEFFSNDLIIDCGANVGDLKLYFDCKKINVDYFGIEASAEEFQCLKKNTEPSNLKNIGLWSENKQLEFFTSLDNGDSSLIEPLKYSKKEIISVNRLDKLVDKSKKIKLLKLEAEGAEPEVLIGCGNLLNQIEYISADLGYERGKKQESTFLSVTNFLLKNDFELIEVNLIRITALFKNKKNNI